METPKKKLGEVTLNGFSPISSTPVFWKSRRRSGGYYDSALLLYSIMLSTIQNVGKATDDPSGKTPEKQESPTDEKKQEDSEMEPENQETPTEGEKQDSAMASLLSEKRKALFEPLEPITNINGKRPLAESLLPPPDFDSASYPRGWLIGKKRKLVNVDVVESMRRIAIQEMNRKDREIDGLNEQLESDAQVLEHLQIQLLEERSKRADVERENAMLQNQINMLMNMLQDSNGMDDEGGSDEP
ncbi:hypothetical protein RHMOL_Rhmol12G0218800 [Rhododendron molle]|uniref:Uncharacterized protein n=1 Tax=Rhododendron molle TaxID=49168 RepID=A0ACC0LLX8_RHOML|nr:hypothetical protein RHMOL_Rhmol12G0218800 [Rhododendron molle]